MLRSYQIQKVEGRYLFSFRMILLLKLTQILYNLHVVELGAKVTSNRTTKIVNSDGQMKWTFVKSEKPSKLLDR